MFKKYYKGNQIKDAGKVEHVARRGDIRNAYISVVGKYEWKKPLGRPKGR
jgi:hypothetical protein